MPCCIVCGDSTSDGSKDYRCEKVSNLSVARFAVKVFLELGDLFEDYLSIDKLYTWWATCDVCGELIQESFEIYRQLVNLTRKFGRNRQKIVDKCRTLGQLREESHNNLEPSQTKTSIGEENETARIFQTALQNRSWSDVFSIPYGEDGFLEETLVKEELYINLEDPEIISELVKHEKEDETSSAEGEDDTCSQISSNEKNVDECFINDDEEEEAEISSEIDSSVNEEDLSQDNVNCSEDDPLSGDRVKGCCSPGEEGKDNKAPIEGSSNFEYLETTAKPRQKRGRPRKNDKADDFISSRDLSLNSKSIKRKRGRPRNIEETGSRSEDEVVKEELESNDESEWEESEWEFSDSDSNGSITDNNDLNKEHLKWEGTSEQGRYLETDDNPCSSAPLQGPLKRARKRQSNRQQRDPDPSKTKRPRKVNPEKAKQERMKYNVKILAHTELQRDPDTKLYHCPSCDYTNLNTTRLRNHYSRIHLKETQQYSCEWSDCGRTFKVKKNLTFHMAQHNGKPKYKCDQCTLAFYRPNALTRHRQLDHEGGRLDKNKFVCDKCGKGYGDRDGLYAHNYQMHSKGPKKPCELCGKVLYRGFIKRHMNVAHGKSISGETLDRTGSEKICELCGKTLMTDCSFKLHMWNAHRKTVDGGGKLECSVCRHRFGHQQFLDVHMYSKHNIGDPSVIQSRKKQQWKCDVQGCRQKYNNEDNYKTHMAKIHGRDKKKPGQFQCRFCGKRFFIQLKHEYHERSHENAESKPFVCEECGKGFQTQPCLRQHLQKTHKLKMVNRQGFRNLNLKGELQGSG